MPSLDSIIFDTTDFIPFGDHNSVRVWRTPEGDGFALLYDPRPPDKPLLAGSVNEVRIFCREEAQAQGSAILEADIVELDGCRAVRTIMKAPQKPRGMTYWGTLTLPFHNFNHVIKIQCFETGTTGVRDSVVLNSQLKSGEVRLGNPGELLGWMQDPYDPSRTGAFARNRSDAEEYDERFPKHPLSRLRRALIHVQQTLKFADDIKPEPRN